MTQVMGIQPTKESRAPEGRKKCELSFFRPSGASLYLATNDPRLAPWAIFRRPLRGPLFIFCPIHTARERVGPNVDVMAVIKADAYGHGAVSCARRLASEGARWFAVALPEEAIELR